VDPCNLRKTRGQCYDHYFLPKKGVSIFFSLFWAIIFFQIVTLTPLSLTFGIKFSHSIQNVKKGIQLSNLKNAHSRPNIFDKVPLWLSFDQQKLGFFPAKANSVQGD
jgi:hypothetical protein